MHFDAQHDFAAPRATVAELLCDPAFHTQLDLPDLSRPVVVEHSTAGATRLLRLRYEYVGQIDPIARKIIGGHRLTWIQELRLDTSDYTGTLSFSSESDPDRLFGEARVVIVALDNDARSQRRISGDLHVRVPLVGSTAERRIGPGLVRRLDVEAAALSTDIATHA